jgi:hypothetical protein
MYYQELLSSRTAAHLTEGYGWRSIAACHRHEALTVGFLLTAKGLVIHVVLFGFPALFPSLFGKECDYLTNIRNG